MNVKKKIKVAALPKAVTPGVPILSIESGMAAAFLKVPQAMMPLIAPLIRAPSPESRMRGVGENCMLFLLEYKSAAVKMNYRLQLS